MDGTIVDNMEFHNSVWIDLFKENGLTVTLDEMQTKSAGLKNTEVIALFLGNHLSEDELHAFGKRKEALYRDAFKPHLKPLPGLKEFIQQAKSMRVLLALATAANPENISFVLEGIGLTDCFDAIVGGEEVKNGKPHPDIFLEAARRLNMPADRCVVFEDAPAGVEAAHRAGMKLVVITTSFQTSTLAQCEPYMFAAPDFTTLNAASIAGAI